jgi:hypothetical protein
LARNHLFCLFVSELTARRKYAMKTAARASTMAQSKKVPPLICIVDDDESISPDCSPDATVERKQESQEMVQNRGV